MSLSGLIGCLGTKQQIKEPESFSSFWGTKQEIVEFLNGPHAQSNRWIIERIGE